MNIIAQELLSVVNLPVMYVVTTNAFIKGSGELVMGRGAAFQVKTKFPHLPKECGVAINQLGSYPVSYGFLEIRSPYRIGKAGFGIFQVKNNYSDDANINIIVKACLALKKWMDSNPAVNVRMNYPGIGNGRLTRATVEPVLTSILKDCKRLTICTHG